MLVLERGEQCAEVDKENVVPQHVEIVQNCIKVHSPKSSPQNHSQGKLGKKQSVVSLRDIVHSLFN